MTATTAKGKAQPAADNVRGWDRKEMAARLAQDIPEGWYVNLGIGIPLLVGNYIPEDREVVLQSENGILGMGPLQTRANLDTWIVNAGKQNVTLRTGASIVGHADSFAMIRGGHLDLCVLGSFEVAENGDFANWTTSLKSVPAVGGAMDLAVGAKRIWLIMEHTSKDGKPRLLERCTMPLTAVGVVKRVYTNLAVVDVTERGFELVEMNPEITFEALQARTGAKLHRRS
jgi:3-oxoadipate CoA-transferase beta subunit